MRTTQDPFKRFPWLERLLLGCTDDKVRVFRRKTGEAASSLTKKILDRHRKHPQLHACFVLNESGEELENWIIKYADDERIHSEIIWLQYGTPKYLVFTDAGSSDRVALHELV